MRFVKWDRGPIFLDKDWPNEVNKKLISVFYSQQIAETIEQGFIGTLFLVPKKGGGQRLVVHDALRPWNQYIPYEHFKMEGFICYGTF